MGTREKKMTIRKAGIWAAVTAVLLGTLTGTARATSPASFTITVTVNASLSLNLGGSTVYNFGTISPSTEVVSTAAIVVTNDSTGLVEDYTIVSSTFFATTGGGPNWNISGTLNGGTDVFALCAAMATSQMTVSSFTAAGTETCFVANQTGSATYMNTAQFETSAVSGNAGNGDHVPAAGVRDLWLYFASPTQISDDAAIGQPQSITVTLTANSATLFP
jgi:hypothetical protein